MYRDNEYAQALSKISELKKENEEFKKEIKKFQKQLKAKKAPTTPVKNGIFKRLVNVFIIFPAIWPIRAILAVAIGIIGFLPAMVIGYIVYNEPERFLCFSKSGYYIDPMGPVISLSAWLLSNNPNFWADQKQLREEYFRK